MSKKNSNSFTDSDFVVRAHVPQPEQSTEAKVVNGFSIESVDVPKCIRKGTSLAYPINSLTAGSNESFLIPAASDKVKAFSSSVRTFAYRNKFKIIIRPVEGGIRVWRKV